MFHRDKYRDIAAEYKEKSAQSENPEESARYDKLGKSNTILADNEEWLRDNYKGTLHVNSDAGDPPFEERRALKCLGAAVLMLWNDLAPEMQRAIFDAAGSVGEVENTAELRGEIARLLERYRHGS